MGSLFLIGTVLLFMAHYLPLHIDEAITYRSFSSQGWKIAISSYPFPNNHVFFSLLTTVAVTGPLDPLLAIRMVSVLAALLNFYLIFRIIRLQLNWQWSIFGSILWFSSMGGMYYGVYARGYGLQLTFILFALFSLLMAGSEHKTNGSKMNFMPWASFVVASALGFFTIPTFLFPFASFMAIILMGRSTVKVRITTILALSMATGALTILFYTPLFYYSGVGSILHNQWVDERSFERLTSAQFVQFFHDLCAYVSYLVLILAVGALCATIYFKSLRMVVMAVSFLVIPFILMLIMGSLPFPRTFTYLSAILAIFIATVAGKLLEKRPMGLHIVVSVLLMGAVANTAWGLTRGKESSAAEVALQLHQQTKERNELNVVYTHGWTETGSMLDFYSWYRSDGPAVRPIHSEQFWTKFQELNGRYVLEEQGKRQPESSKVVARSGSVAIYDCH